MRKLIIMVLALALAVPSLTLANGGNRDVMTFTYQKITWTFVAQSDDSAVTNFCQKLETLASNQIFQRNESDLYFTVSLKSTGNEVAMEELTLAHEGLTIESCKKAMSTSLIGTAPLRPAEFMKHKPTSGLQVDKTDFITGKEPLKLDGTSMATPALLSRRHSGNAYGDHIGAYNFSVEISGIAAATFESDKKK